jgi:general secretion pathway protein E
LGNADAQAIKRTAQESGMDTMREDGARKVLAGMTTVEEVMAATQEDIIVDE